jgi:hypothetical protein
MLLLVFLFLSLLVVAAVAASRRHPLRGACCCRAPIAPRLSLDGEPLRALAVQVVRLGVAHAVRLAPQRIDRHNFPAVALAVAAHR